MSELRMAIHQAVDEALAPVLGCGVLRAIRLRHPALPLLSLLLLLLALLQGLALEKLLTVTSCVQPDPSPPPLPSLASLGPVNDNPLSPYQDGRAPVLVQPLPQQPQQPAALQQHPSQEQAEDGTPRPEPNEAERQHGLPNGTYGPHAGLSGGETFAYFLDAEIVGGGAGGPGSQLVGDHQPADAAPAAASLPPLDAAEVARAEAFVEAALVDGITAAGEEGGRAGEDETAGGEGATQATASPPPTCRQEAGSLGEESVPPTPEGPTLQTAPPGLAEPVSVEDATETAIPCPTSTAMDTDALTAAGGTAGEAMDASPTPSVANSEAEPSVPTAAQTLEQPAEEMVS